VTSFGLLGAPSSAGAYAAGQERAPSALREAALVDALRAHGAEVSDHGDTPAFRWRPDRANPRAQNLDAVVAGARAVADRVERIVRAGQVALVVGGDCTNGIGTYAGAVAAEPGTALVYFDKHSDLNTPVSVVDGALDWMGVAHLLGIDDACPALRDIGPRSPLLRPQDLVLFAWRAASTTEHERAVVDRLNLRTIPDTAVVDDPGGSAEAALQALAPAPRIAVHLDVDVLDFLDAPLAENTDRNGGPSLDQAFAALAGLVADGRLAALTITELNPDHAEPDLLARFVEGLAAALAPGS
jgi:arginase